ncbi:MAG: hypothetical protein J7497_09745, partial [Chitinophagaceae bacterium]|nr:hypothetical protein [Chitinophagaceae bacterium]
SNNDSLNVSINEASVIPRYNKIAFGKRAGHQVDRTEMKLNKIQLKNISTGDLIKHRLKAHTFSIHHLNVSVFRDRRLPRLKDTQYLPVEMIRQIPVPVHLDTFKIDNGVVEYEEFPKEGDHTGTLKIENAGITITPFISHHLKGDPDRMLMTTKGSIMGSGKIFASIYLPFHSDNYKVKGAIENLELTKLNDGSENLGKIHIKSGFLDSLGFDFSFNKVKSSGKIVGVYHQLIIQPLKNNSDKKKIAKFRSFVLRHLIIPLNKDRSLAEKKRTGEIDYPYDPTRKVSYYLLQSLLTGIKSSFKLGFLLPK